VDPREYDWQMGDLADQSNYPPGVDPSEIGTAVKNWWTNQPSWLSRAQVENQKTTEAFQRGGMGEIAKQLATDTKEAQDLGGGFTVGRIGSVGGRWPTGFAPGSVLSPDYAVNKVVKYGGAAPEVRTDPLHHGFSGLKTGKTTDEMAAEIIGAPNITRPLIKPEDLKGSELIFAPGDRGAGGGTMTSVGGTKLERPVKLEAGADYPFLHGDKPIAGLPEDARRLWANAPGQSTAMLNLGNEALRQGRQPVLMYQAMGKEALDSSKQLALPAVDLAKQKDISKAGVSFINKWMEGVEGFPGWSSPKLSDWLEQTSGTNRSRLMKGMDTRQARDAGFPDMGELRYTQTNPKLRSTPTGSVGLTVSKLDPSLGRVEQSLHTTYPTAVAGTEAGTLGGSIPWHVAAPDLHKNLMSLGKPTKFAERPDYYTTKMPQGLPKTQVVDQKWVDQVSEWMRKNPQLWAIPGAAVPGSLAVQDQYR
jgi:hypothetical protein